MSGIIIRRIRIEKIAAVLIAAVLCVSILGLCTSTASAWSGSYTYPTKTAYPGDNLTYKVNVRNSGDTTAQINSATLTIDWGAVTTERAMSGISSLDPGESGVLSCYFTVPAVSPDVYTVSIGVNGKAVGDLWANTVPGTTTITIMPIPDLSVTVGATTTSGRAPLQVTLSCTASGVPPYTYSWNFGEGTTSDAQNNWFMYETPGTYTATCIVHDSKGRTASDSITITVSGAPTLSASIQATKTSGSAPLSSSLSVSPSGGTGSYTYYWTFGDGGTSTSQFPSHTYTKGGTYTAVCVVTDGDSHKASDSIIISVQGNPSDITDTTTGGGGSLFGSTVMVLALVGIIAAVVIVISVLVMRKKG